MNIKSLIIVAVLAASSTSFAKIPTNPGQPDAPCPAAVAHRKQGLSGLLGNTSAQQANLNARVLAGYATAKPKNQAVKAPAAAEDASTGIIGIK